MEQCHKLGERMANVESWGILTLSGSRDKLVQPFYVAAVAAAFSVLTAFAAALSVLTAVAACFALCAALSVHECDTRFSQ